MRYGGKREKKEEGDKEKKDEGEESIDEGETEGKRKKNREAC